MRRLIIPLLLSSAGALGCAGSAANSQGSLQELRELSQSLEQRDAQLAQLEQERDELEARDRRLRAELALSRADARELRSELEMRRQTHRIAAAPRTNSGGWIEQDGFAANARHEVEASPTSDPSLESDDEVEAPESEQASDLPRPVLRLYGAPAAGSSQPTMSAATLAPGTPPFGVRPSAQVAPLPSSALLPASPRVPAAAPDDAAVREYREALAMVRDRRLDAALPALERFVAAHPNHPYADNALYWRGEVFFLRHQFPQALREYARLLSTYPRGNKVADALLRTGICHLRMGDAARARASFRRLRESFPQSVAARRASREDAS
jgi:tol-pal system protein YbgF